VIQEVSAIHQQAREYVEQEHPGYKVTKVYSAGDSAYMPTMGTQWSAHPEYVLTLADVRFTVTARKDPMTPVSDPGQPKEITCYLRVANDQFMQTGMQVTF